MIPIRNRRHDQRFELTGPLKRPGQLTAEDIVRLSAKREEIILTLQLWHGYSRGVADQVLSRWLYHNDLPRGGRAADATRA